MATGCPAGRANGGPMAHENDETTTARSGGSSGERRGGGSTGSFLRRRYVGDDIARAASVEQERVNAQVAQLIYDQRKAAGLSQRELAELIGTQQSVISRLESADYDGHSLTMLERIAHAVNRRLRVAMERTDAPEPGSPSPAQPESHSAEEGAAPTRALYAERASGERPAKTVREGDSTRRRAGATGPGAAHDAAPYGTVRPEDNIIQFVFREVVQGLRRQRGLTVDQFAQKLGADRDEVLGMERTPGYRPRPVLLYKLSQFSGIPQRRLALLAGAIARVPADVREEASRFAAKSESFAKLSRDEQRLLDEFVKFLKAEV